MQSLGSVCHGWSGICFFIKICASIDIIVLDLISCMRHTGHLEGVMKPHDKIILHSEIRDGFLTFQTVSKMRAMTPEMKLCKILDMNVKLKTDESNFRPIVKMRC